MAITPPISSALHWERIRHSKSIETSFHQDLNGDGIIGVPFSTSLFQVGSNYFLNPVAGGTGPELKINGAAVVAGQSGGWTPIGAEQTATGYEVAWKLTGSNEFSVWATDSNGNYTSNLIGVASGTDSALETIETSFHQDLNGDGTIGLVTNVIESFGSTSLVQVGSNYFLNPVAGGTGPELKINGAAVVAGQSGGWTPIGTEQTATGYEVAWKLTGSNEYSVWATDSNGNYTSNLIGVASGTESALESIETSFHQDLNGDGTIGPITNVIESFGSTSLVQVGSNYFLDPVAGGTGPELKINGAAVVAGQSGGWMPIGTEQTATGYEVAWKLTGTNQFSVWATDSNGNYTSNLIGIASGTDSALELIETSFHQELNGAPTLTISNLAPTVSAGGSIPLGVQVTPADADDAVSVTISGLTSYETITDNLDQTVFSGGSVTLSAAEVNSGLTLYSSYGGTGLPVNNLVVTASNTTLGEAAISVAQTIVVTDPPVVASSPPQSILPAPSNVAMADFNSHGGAPPTGLAPSAYTALAGLLDQYMAAGSQHNAPGVTSWTASQQAWLGGDKEFLTRPHG